MSTIKTETTSLIHEVVPNIVTKEKEDFSYQKTIEITSLAIDTSSSAQEPLHFVQIKKPSKEREDSAKEISSEEESELSFSDEFDTNHQKVKKNITQQKELFEERYVDTIISAAAPAIVSLSATTPLTKEPLSRSLSTESPSKSWKSTVINTTMNYLNSWTGLFSKSVEKPLEPVEGVDDSGAISPLGSRPVLSEPISIQKDQLRKYIHEMKIALARIENATDGETEIVTHVEADILMLATIKKFSLYQAELNQEAMTQLTNYHHEILEKQKESIDVIRDIHSRLNKQVDSSQVLGWVNTTMTAIVLGGAAVIIISTAAPTMGASTGLIPGLTGVAAGVGKIGVAAGLFEGFSTIAKGVIDHQAQKNRAELSSIATDRQIRGNHIDNNNNSIERVISSLHQNNERIIAALAMQRDTIRYAQQS